MKSPASRAFSDGWNFTKQRFQSTTRANYDDVPEENAASVFTSVQPSRFRDISSDSDSYSIRNDSGSSWKQITSLPYGIAFDADSNEILIDRNGRLLEQARKAEQDRLKSSIREELVVYLMEFSLEAETTSLAERKIHQIAEEYSFNFLGELLQDICVQYYDNPIVLAGICFALEGFDAGECYPWGQMIFMSVVHHESDMVKERVISLAENWADTTLLPYLKHVEIKSKWMREYFDEVIAELEDAECII